jgi:hypothetical protein
MQDASDNESLKRAAKYRFGSRSIEKPKPPPLNYNVKKGILPNYEKKRLSKETVVEDVKKQLRERSIRKRSLNPTRAYQTEKSKYIKNRGY